MVLLNSNVSWNRMTFEENRVLTRVFNLRGHMLVSKQVLFHSCRPFTIFFVQVIVFYKIDWHSLMEIDVKPISTLGSFVAYWQQIFDITWPQHFLVKGLANPNISHETIEVNTMVIVERLMPSSLTYAIIFAFNPCVYNTWFTCRAMVTLDVSDISNKPMVTWQGSQLWFKKWTIKTKVLTPPFNIYKSKLIVQVSLDLRDCTMNFSLVFSTTFGKVSCIRAHLDGNLTRRFYFKINLLKNGDFTKDKGTNSFAINRSKSFSNCFWWGSSLK